MRKNITTDKIEHFRKCQYVKQIDGCVFLISVYSDIEVDEMPYLVKYDHETKYTKTVYENDKLSIDVIDFGDGKLYRMINININIKSMDMKTIKSL